MTRHDITMYNKKNFPPPPSIIFLMAATGSTKFFYAYRHLINDRILFYGI